MEYNDVELRRQLAHWLTEVTAASPPEENIAAFGIGIVEVEDDFRLYLFGANGFDENSNDWAVDPAYKPSENFLSVRQSGNHFSGWTDCLVNVLSALSVALSSSELTQTRVSDVPFFVGFDDGDLHRVR